MATCSAPSSSTTTRRRRILLSLMTCFTLAASHGAIVVHASSFSFNFDDFDFTTSSTSSLADFTIAGDAEPHGKLFDLTPNKYGANISNNVGRVAYKHPVPLRDSATGEAVSFTTSFTFAINITDPDPGTKGDGMAFFLSHFPSELPPLSNGGSLGLCTNFCLNASAVADKDRFVAVEFDTFSNDPFDPSLTRDHMGIDVNSLRSLANITLPTFSLNGTMSARVDYNSNTGVMNVELQLVHRPMFNYLTATYNMSAKVNLTTALPEQVAIGFSAATGRAMELHQLLSWSFSLISPSTGRSSSNSGRRIILIVLTAATATLLFPCICVLIWRRKGGKLRYLCCTKTSSTSERNIESVIVSYGSLAPKRYKYSEVKKITSLPDNKLGEGGYGVVFKGKLHDGRLVAVKFLHDSKGNGEEFVNEVMSIGRTSHVNIVSLFGFCLEGSKRALLYEYMPNGSLDKYIYSENPKAILGWEEIYRIAIGIARGLEYLHHGCNTRIIHFDIKPQNILLDQEFCPKIADFGLAKLCRAQESRISMTGARGTIGFIAPEVLYKTFGVVSTKSDVYSYGMMLLEMVGGRRNAKSMVEKSSEKYFPDWIYDHFALDDGLQACEVTSEFEQIAKRMTVIGLWCVQVLPMHRPTTTQVLDMFDKSLDELEMPPKQNFLELLEHPVHRLSEESTSSTRNTNATEEALSDVLKVEETSLVNLENLAMTTPTLRKDDPQYSKIKTPGSNFGIVS